VPQLKQLAWEADPVSFASVKLEPSRGVLELDRMRRRGVTAEPENSRGGDQLDTKKTGLTLD